MNDAANIKSLPPPLNRYSVLSSEESVNDGLREVSNGHFLPDCTLYAVIDHICPFVPLRYKMVNLFLVG